MNSRFLLLGCLGCWPVSWLFAAAAWAADIETVLNSVAVSPPARVEFIELRNNPLFEEPMELTGYLEYLAPGKMRKVIQSPFNESYLVDQDHVAVERDGNVRKLPTRAARSLQSMLSGLEAMLSGDRDMLEKDFEYDLQGCIQNWTLSMQPRSKKVSRRLSGLVVRGDDARVHSIRVDLPGDEWHSMQLLDTATQ